MCERRYRRRCASRRQRRRFYRTTKRLVIGRPLEYLNTTPGLVSEPRRGTVRQAGIARDHSITSSSYFRRKHRPRYTNYNTQSKLLNSTIKRDNGVSRDTFPLSLSLVFFGRIKKSRFARVQRSWPGRVLYIIIAHIIHSHLTSREMFIPFNRKWNDPRRGFENVPPGNVREREEISILHLSVRVVNKKTLRDITPDRR